MEKIYDQNYINNKNISPLKKLFKSSFSVKCSFLLSIISIFCISFSSFGNTNNSYAIKDSSIPNDIFNSKVSSYYIQDNITGYKMYKYTTDDGIPLYRANNNNIISDSKFIKENTLDKFPYEIITNGYPFTDLTINDVKLDDDTKYWITQIAIWFYLDDNGSSIIDSSDTSKLINTKNITLIKSNSKDSIQINNLYQNYIKPLTYNVTEGNNNIIISMDSSKFTLDLDKKIYRSGLIKVSYDKPNNYQGYEIFIKNLPLGTKVYSKDKKEIKNILSMSDFKSNVIEKNNKFYLEIPIKSLNNDNKDIKININAELNSSSGLTYKSNNSHLFSAYKTNSFINSGIELNINHKFVNYLVCFSYVMYILGIILFLIGIGIFYEKVCKKSKKIKKK